MRGGYFLAEESPEQLIVQFGAESLEDVFLKLSVIQNMGKRRRSSILQSVTDAIPIPAGSVNEGAILDDEVGEISGEFGDNTSMSGRSARRVSIAPDASVETIPPELPPEEETEVKWTDYLKIVKWSHMRALVWKNFLWMWRNIPVMTFIIGLPVGQMILFCLSIGHDPNDVTLSVVNNEINYPMERCEYKAGCNASYLSCNYLDYISNNYSLIMNYYATEAEARQTVEKGKSWAMLVVPNNFSDSLRSRIDNGKDTPSWDLAGSVIDVFSDKSNENIATFITRDLLFGLEGYAKSFLKQCDIDPKVFGIPIKFETPIYGYGSPDFTDFAAPGIILTIIFFMAVALTSGAMLMERNEGILERTLVNGITGTEVLFSQVITQFVVMFGQTTMVLVFAFPIFQLTQNGNWFNLFSLTILSGVCGMCFGFVVSCVCENERSATYMALGSFLPIVMLCGIIWPIEAMSPYLTWASTCLPLTQATETNILTRALSDEEFDEFVSKIEDFIDDSSSNVWATNNDDYFSSENASSVDYGTFDFIIVGGGTAGGILANRLSEQENFTVLLVEAGKARAAIVDVLGLNSYLVASEWNWAYNTTKQTTGCLGSVDQRCSLGRGKGLGGSSSINDAFVSRGNHKDFDQWADLGDIGWTFEDCLPYFKKTEKTTFSVNASDEPYHGFDGMQSLSRAEDTPILTDALVSAFEELGNSYVDFNGETQYGVALNRTNLNITVESLVTKVILSNKTATGIEFWKNGTKYTATAGKEVIVSAGAVNSPQLLML
ncbi:hypothetical protein HUJ05_009704, partial [Dendroctonus ponderosae]